MSWRLVYGYWHASDSDCPAYRDAQADMPRIVHWHLVLLPLAVVRVAYASLIWGSSHGGIQVE